MIKELQLLCLVLAVSSDAACQNISLECKGIETTIAFGSNDKIQNKTEMYFFKNGLLYGNLVSEWRDDSIRVDIAPVDIDGIVYSRIIIFDRISGTVFDQTKARIKNQPVQDTMVFNFDAKCSKSTSFRKF